MPSSSLPVYVRRRDILLVFFDETTAQGAGLGRQTMPETLRYSTRAGDPDWQRGRGSLMPAGYRSSIPTQRQQRWMCRMDGIFVAYLLRWIAS